MKTQVNKLNFKKNSLIELSQEMQNEIIGGGQTTLICGDCVTRPTSLNNLTKAFA